MVIEMRQARTMAPPRPPSWQEQLGGFLLNALAPRARKRTQQPPPPPRLAPWQEVSIARDASLSPLSGVWFPAASPRPRGSVLLAHPMTPWGKAYFYRHGRIEALRAAGYHVLVFDLPGFGASRPSAGFPDRDVAAALTCLESLAPGLPLHVWGVSWGGHWAHPAVAAGAVSGAFFEDVCPHLLDWSSRTAPLGWPFYSAFRHGLPEADRFIDMRLHARLRRPLACAYVSGARDPGVLPADTRALADAAGADCLIVPKAGHLEAIKVANAQVLQMALQVFHAGSSGHLCLG